MVAHIQPPQTWYDYTYGYPDGYISEDGIDLTDIIFYVGKGTYGRIDEHETEARRGCKCSKCHEIRKIWESGKPVKKRIVFETLVESEALVREGELLTKHAGKYLTNVVMPRIAVSEQRKKVRYFNAIQAARELNISDKTIRRYIDRGIITAVRRKTGQLAISEIEIARIRQDLDLDYAHFGESGNPVTSDNADTLATRVAYLEQKVAALERKISRQGNF